MPSSSSPALDEFVPPLAVPREQVVRRRLKRELIEVLRELLLVRLGIG